MEFKFSEFPYWLPFKFCLQSIHTSCRYLSGQVAIHAGHILL